MLMIDQLLEMEAVAGEDNSSMLVNKLNADLKQKPLKHTPRDFTIRRQEQREVEALALAEALGEWCTKLLGRPVRGAEGFFEDTANGVVPCLVLRAVGVPCEAPRDPPRNEFEAKENCQKFKAACTQAKLASIPSFDSPAGLLPTLIECAARDQAQRKAKKLPSITPVALSKRAENVANPAIENPVTHGEMIPISSHEAKEMNAPPIEPRSTPKHRTIETLHTTDSKITQAYRSRRSVSEIPPQEKDQIMTVFYLATACLISLIVITLLYFH